MMQLPRDIICFALSRWDQDISSPAWSLAKELSKHHRVFYIDHPYTLKDLLVEFNTPQVIRRRKYWAGKTTGYHQPIKGNDNLFVVTPPLVLPVNFLPDNFAYKALSNINERRMNALLATLLEDFNINVYLFFNFFDPFYFQKITVANKPVKYVYQSMDDIAEVRYTAKHGIRLEKQMIRNSDLTICTSKRLLELHRNDGRVAIVENGVDFDLFGGDGKDLAIPADMNSIKRPIIVFTGSIDYRMDFQLVRDIAVAHADKTFFFIGPLNTNEHEPFFFGLSNIILAGPREIHELPAYLHHSDCAIIPYKKNKLTAAIYPLKINEYLACGVPVVTTDFSEDIQSFGECVHLASDANTFAEMISIALTSDNAVTKRKRHAEAAKNSWAKRVEQLQDLL